MKHFSSLYVLLFAGIRFSWFSIAVLLAVGQDAAQTPSFDTLELNKTVISLPCPEGCASISGNCKDGRPEDDRKINVKAIFRQSNTKTQYRYTVSAGKIVGSGPQVIWDLSGARRGTYEILASARDDRIQFSKPLKAEVTVQECPDCICDIDCPSIAVLGPAGATEAGRSVVFTASVTGGSQDGLTYHWRISAGSIVSGQGTPSVEVATTRKMAETSITASLQISQTRAQANHGCINSVSETAYIKARSSKKP